MTTLYELTTEYKNLMDAIDYEEIDLDVIVEQLASIDESIEQKADNIQNIILRNNALDQMDDMEIKRLQERKRRRNTVSQKLKDRLFNYLVAVDKRKFKTEKFSYLIRKNAPSVEITNENNIPDEFFRVKKEVDKIKLKEELKQGVIIDGVQLVQTESLIIK